MGTCGWDIRIDTIIPHAIAIWDMVLTATTEHPTITLIMEELSLATKANGFYVFCYTLLIWTDKITMEHKESIFF